MIAHVKELFFFLTKKKDIAGANDSFLYPHSRSSISKLISTTRYGERQKAHLQTPNPPFSCVDNRKFFVWQKKFWHIKFEIKHNPLCNCHNLPLHLVRLVACPEAEAGGKVAGEEMFLLDGGQKGLVDGLLVGGASTGNLLLL